MASVTRDRKSCGHGTTCFRVHMCMHGCMYLFPFVCVHIHMCAECVETPEDNLRCHSTEDSQLFFNKIFKRFIYFMCLHVCMRFSCLVPTEQIESGSQGLALQLWDIIWVLGIDVRSSARATSANSPAPQFLFDTLAWSPPIQARLAG